MDSRTLDHFAVVGPHIYSDGSRIEGKLGATLTEWRDREGTWYSTLRLDSFCTVFQAEMVALERAIQRVKNGKDTLVNVFSESRSALEVLTGPLAREARRDISDIVAHAALTKKTAADYDKFPLSYAKKVIRAASMEEWQERYAEESTGEITKCFFPRVKQAYRVLRKIEMTSQIVQTLTEYGGFAQYPHRFKLKDSTYYACDPAKIQDVLHVLEECPMFLRERIALEMEICVIVGRREFPTIIDDDKKKRKVFRIFAKARNINHTQRSKSREVSRRRPPLSTGTRQNSARSNFLGERPCLPGPVIIAKYRRLRSRGDGAPASAQRVNDGRPYLNHSISFPFHGLRGKLLWLIRLREFLHF
ncbi:hypothetical protein EVAR_9635_1 [Eumeta japonica]|uniref:115 kDa protein in type-1 retrotransposable element R1DM n=1 Tax=Eumeta variegata TaxID=151549 RepID=A0A4C1TJS1_EUMVA|nr:hypothetical protein EVAR_9635_1 [Eumeta japonica]